MLNFRRMGIALLLVAVGVLIGQTFSGPPAYAQPTTPKCVVAKTLGSVKAGGNEILWFENAEGTVTAVNVTMNCLPLFVINRQ